MRALLSNLITLLLALALATLVWYVAVSEENPFDEQTLTAPIPVAFENLPPDLIRISPDSAQTVLTVRAPRSLLAGLTPDQIRVVADLSGLEARQYDVPLTVRFASSSLRFVRVTRMNPPTVRVTLEQRTTRERAVRVELTGEPATGYEAGEPIVGLQTASVIGPSSAVDRVSELVGQASLANLNSDFDQSVPLVPVDVSGGRVQDVNVEPASVPVTVPIKQRAGTRNIAVIVDIRGQPPAGYRVTNISVAPPVITVSSSDPQRVNDLPGFVSTQPLDLSSASDDITQKLGLVLPEGVSPLGEPTVLVQVSIAAIEGSTRVQRPLEVQSLGVGLVAEASPETVDVLISGPLPVLDRLQDSDVRVILDLDGLSPGTYTITPTVIFLADNLRADSVLPNTVEVVIRRGTPSTRTPTITPTPLPTPTRTRLPLPTFTMTPVAPPSETPSPQP